MNPARLRGNIVSAHIGRKPLAVLLPAMMQRCVDEVSIHPTYKLDGNFFGADRFALAVVRATAEDFLRHGGDHVQRSPVALRLPLR